MAMTRQAMAQGAAIGTQRACSSAAVGMVALAGALAGFGCAVGAWVATLCAALLLVGVGCGPLAQALLLVLQRPYLGLSAMSWGERNVIVVLGAGVQSPGHRALCEPGPFGFSRIVESARAYHECRADGHACRIYVSGGDAMGVGVPEAELYSRWLGDLGVRDADLVVEGESLNTWQNAQKVARLLPAWGPDRVVLVSSGLHLRRAMLYLRHFGIDAIPRRADVFLARASWLPLAFNFLMADFALHECLGIARYRLLRALGRTPELIRPGNA